MLQRLGGVDTPSLLEHGTDGGRPYVALEWCEGVSIAVAAQQARATRDRRRLHDLVGRMLEAYGRLHERGVLHGDVHPGNCLVRDDGRVVVIDFGNARALGEPPGEVDPARAGIPQFHDPLMARALLAGAPPPAATPASEHFALAVLAYLLLTGLYPLDAPAVQDELLRPWRGPSRCSGSTRSRESRGGSPARAARWRGPPARGCPRPRRRSWWPSGWDRSGRSCRPASCRRSPGVAGRAVQLPRRAPDEGTGRPA